MVLPASLRTTLGKKIEPEESTGLWSKVKSGASSAFQTPLIQNTLAGLQMPQDFLSLAIQGKNPLGAFVPYAFGGEDIASPGEMLTKNMEPGWLKTTAEIGTNIATDPLTYLGGLGAATKVGRAGKIVKGLEKSGKIAKTAEAKKAVDLLRKSGKTAAEAAGEKADILLNIPWTGLEKGIQIPEILKRPARALGKTAPMQKLGAVRESVNTGLGKLFTTGVKPHLGQYGKETVEALEGLKGKHFTSIREGAYDVAEQVGKYANDIQAIKTEIPELAGKADEDIYRYMYSVAEGRNVAPAQARGIIKEIRDNFDSMLAKEQGLNIDVAEFKGLTEGGREIQYMPRYPSEAGKEFFKKGIFRPRKPFSARDISNIKRSPEGAANFTEDWMKMLAEETGVKDIFETNILGATGMRGVRSVEKISNAELAQGVADTFAKHHPNIGKSADTVSIKDFLNSKGMKFNSAEIEARGWKDKYIPNDVIGYFENQYRVWPKDEITPVVNLYDQFLNFSKGAVTSWFPAFHGRNMLSNIMLGWQGGNRNIKNYAEAITYQSKRPFAIAMADGTILDKKALHRKFVTHNIETRGFAREFMGEGTLGESTSDVFNTVLGKQEKGGLFGFGRRAGNLVENNARISMALDLIKKGHTDWTEIGKHVNKYFFDYADLSKFEKTYMRRMFFFYTFSRKNMALQAEHLVKNPRFIQMQSQLTQQTKPGVRGELPEFMQSRFNIPLPSRSKEGFEQFITSLGTPIEEAFENIGAPKNILQRLGAKLAPVPKMLIEMGSGKNLFKGIPIDDDMKAYSILNALPQFAKNMIDFKTYKGKDGVERYRANPRALWVLSQPPWSRFIQTADKFYDLYKGKKDLPSTMANVFSGVRISAIDPEEQAYFKTKKEFTDVMEKLRRSWDVGEFKRYYLYPDEKDTEKGGAIKEYLKKYYDSLKDRRGKSKGD